MVEFRVGEDGLPYAVEFSNVSIWPRQPEASSKLTGTTLADRRDGHRPLGRSHTMPSAPTAAAQKPLPSLPNEGPARTGSLRRIFRRRFSEPGRRPQIHNNWMSPPSRPREGRPENSLRGQDTEIDEHIRDSVATLSLFPEGEQPEEDVIPIVEAPRVRSLRRRPPISVLDHISSAIPEASPMLTVPAHKRRHHPEAEPEPDPPADEFNLRFGGLHICFPDGRHPDLQTKSPASRLRRLSRTIAQAVSDSGMTSPNKADGNGNSSSDPCSQSFFSGTYGQVRTALHSAGLVVKKCEEGGFDGASRIGNVFVANHDVHENVIFTKIVLYGTC